ncbi:MAG: NAD(P)H-hydrate epimerase [Candidatus Dormibacteraeota bacterium]|nr:NAD(P)H-hydrate epimerase [Candidatus Dormibacteraeota bacterium]MBV9525096.1 NAD(P)H-hydrate epimerase [Candidatus Dormibacteraeota bacterium]
MTDLGGMANEDQVVDGSFAVWGAVSADDVAALDRAAIGCGVSVAQLMEVAGWQVARCAWMHMDEQPGSVLVLAGHGNNGGDGLVAARHLRTWGCSVEVRVLADERSLSELATAHVASARANGVEVTASSDGEGALATLRRPHDVVVDALLGTGLHAAPREPAASVIRAIDAAAQRVLSVDVPSGLDATTGEAYAPCVRATWTCTLAAMKRGLWNDAWRLGAPHCGEVWVADIGIPLAAWRAIGLPRPAGVRGGALLQATTTS